MNLTGREPARKEAKAEEWRVAVGAIITGEMESYFDKQIDLIVAAHCRAR